MDILYERQIEKEYSKILNTNLGNKILEQIKELYNIQGELYLHPEFRYLEEVGVNIDFPYSSIVYKKSNKYYLYTLRFNSGCFNPYLYAVTYKINNTWSNNIEELMQEYPKCKYFKDLIVDYEILKIKNKNHGK